MFLSTRSGSKILHAGLIAIATCEAPLVASAATVNGADLESTAGVSFPNANNTNVGASVQFAGAPTNQVMVNIDLSALGYGVGVGQTSSGSVTINSTMITNDTDFHIGLYDGNSFPQVTFWDGNRSSSYETGLITNGGTTFTSSSGAGTVDLTTPISVGESATHVIDFDLVALTLGNTINGQNIRSGLAMGGGFDASNPLSFIIGKGSPGEIMQIDSISLAGLGEGSGPPTGPAPVPVPASLPFLILGIGGLFAIRRKRAL